MLPLRILVRTETPWQDMTKESFKAQRDPQTPTEFIRVARDVLPRWEEAYGLPYFWYRHKIRTICEAHERSLGIPVTVGINNVDWDGPDEMLLPIDDDDTHFQSVTSLECNENTNVVIWSRVTNYLGNERIEKPTYGGLLDTCNWGVRKHFVRMWPLGIRQYILARHWTAAGYLDVRLGGKPRPTDLLGKARATLNPAQFEPKLNHPTVVRTDARHSVYYLHSASISFLVHKMTERRDTVAYLRGLPLHPLWKRGDDQ